MFIYKITNKINNKVYIGQTVRPITDRFKRHINDAINNNLDTHFARAIRKYGAENFSVELIDTAINQDELNQKEQYWIQYYDSVHLGYNETDAIYKCGGNTYLSKTDDELNEIGRKISSSKIGNLNPKARKLKCKNIATEEEIHFETFRDCKDYFQESNHNFAVRRCKRTVRSLYKNVWMFAYEEDDYVEYNQNKRTRTHIKVLDLETNEEKFFKTYSEAERYYGLNNRELSKITHIKGEEFIIRNKYKITILN